MKKCLRFVTILKMFYIIFSIRRVYFEIKKHLYVLKKIASTNWKNVFLKKFLNEKIFIKRKARIVFKY